ncbi:MAG: hypothetical protein MJZ76_05650, partial [Bacteroidales bacterium]|nr:hypothetical protein [Bacteroidales bacterium]
DSQASPAQTGRFFTKRLRQGDSQVGNGKPEGNDKGAGKIFLSVKMRWLLLRCNYFVYYL